MEPESKLPTEQEPAAPAPACERITVKITEETLFDFFLYHAYSKFNGFLQNLLGFAVIFMGIWSFVTGRTGVPGMLLYIVIGVAFLGYTPFLLRRRAREAMKEDLYAQPMDITFDEEKGITVEQAGSARLYPWTEVQRAAVTPKTIAVYVGDEQALIIPKWDFGDRFASCYQIIARGLRSSRVPKDANKGS